MIEVFVVVSKRFLNFQKKKKWRRGLVRAGAVTTAQAQLATHALGADNKIVEQYIPSNHEILKILNKASAQCIFRCSVNYCGLKCYQSEAHRACSEGFYKECVERELHGQGLGEESKKKMQDILHRVHRKEEDEEEDVIDSDDEEDAEELEKRLEGVDLEDTSQVWSSLTKEEKRQFQEMVNSGELVGLMPEYKPWWKHRMKLKKIVEVGKEEEELDETLRNSCPTVCDNIPSLRNAMKNPSPFIKFGLLNLLYGYAYAVKFFNGDYNAVNGAHFVEIIQVRIHRNGQITCFFSSAAGFNSGWSEL